MAPEIGPFTTQAGALAAPKHLYISVGGGGGGLPVSHEICPLFSAKIASNAAVLLVKAVSEKCGQMT